jgi:hypothetical protein
MLTTKFLPMTNHLRRRVFGAGLKAEATVQVKAKSVKNVRHANMSRQKKKEANARVEKNEFSVKVQLLIGGVTRRVSVLLLLSDCLELANRLRLGVRLKGKTED